MKEFTVILYAGGNNRLSNDLSLPKALLPIGNRPLIWYSLQLIQSHPSLSTSPLLILTSTSNRQSLDNYLSTLNLVYELIVCRQHRESTNADDHQQSTLDELGTLDILHSCFPRIRTESICLLTCDLFGKIDLTSMINTFRVRDASMMMLLLPTTTTSRDALTQPGQKTKFTPEPEFYTVDSTSQTVTSIRLKADLDEYFPLRQNILAKYPRIIIRTDLVDAHLYLIKKSVLDIAIRSKYSSFRKEFLPKLIQQLAVGQSLEDLISSTNNQRKILDRQKTTDLDDYDDLSKVLENYQTETKQIHRGCYYSTGETNLFRVKNVISYLEANRQAASVISSYTTEDVTYKDRLEQVQVSADCVVADGCDLGKRTLIKRTIIGKNCRIEDKCRITNCVLLDNVHVKEGAILQNSILCSQSIIGTKCDIQNSIVCSNQQVDGNKKLSGETISSQTDDGSTFVISDDEQ